MVVSNFLISHPSIAAEWHPTKNHKLLPQNVTFGSVKKIWWLCNKGHEWQDTVNHRTGGRGCPYCSGRRASNDQCLRTMNPTVASQRHPVKNGDLTTRDVTTGSQKKVWWICSRGHEWEASIVNRHKGRSCPFCFSQTSQLELRVLTELKYIFKNVLHRKKIEGSEIDVFIPQLKIGIEIDGYHWHKDKMDFDARKTAFLENIGINVIRLREKGLKKISSNDITYVHRKNEYDLLRIIITKIMTIRTLNEDLTNKIREYLIAGIFANDDEYMGLLSILPSPIEELSLEYCNSDLALEWHPEKNGGLTPRDVTVNSNMKVWWRCINGHNWQSFIYNRSSGSGCPYCAGQIASPDTCLHNINPSLASEWHPNNNLDLTPYDVMPSSHKKVWWLCKKGHEWEATIKDRAAGNNCPYCSGKRLNNYNSLYAINPVLSKEWHPQKNANLNPSDVTPNSGKKVWWICSKGHEWKTSIDNRNGKGAGCPYCANRLVCTENSLQTINPRLSSEWHPTKNNKLTPNDVVAGSHKKAWWICIKGHEWSAEISSRNIGRGCPYCRRNINK